MSNKPNTQNYITLPTKEKVFNNERNVKQFLNRITVIYGATMTGKTTLMFDILHILQKKIAIPVVFCPTTGSESNSTYKNSFPQSLIYKDVDLTRIEQIYRTQEEKAKKYSIANQMNILRVLFDHISTDHDQIMSAKIIKAYNKIINGIDTMAHNFAIKKTMKQEAMDKLNQSLKMQWKSCIKKNRHKFDHIELKSHEKTALKYLDFNPHLLIVFDDCAAHAKEWSKSPIMKELFYNGRHIHITQLYTLQSDKSIPPGLRKNAHNSIFTDESSACTFSRASTNGVSKNTQKLIENVANTIFSMEEGKRTHTKLIYSVVYNPSVTVILADMYDNNKMGSSYVWEYDKKLPRKNQMMHDLANDKSYMNSFH